ncbi:LexA family protein [Latilactobacillus sakei]
MDKERNKIIAANIKKYIQQNHMTQKELAKAIGISPSTMSDYMNLRSNPSQGVIQKISTYFGILKSDIDTTYKVDINAKNSNILSIYNKLKPDRQEKVYKCAKYELEDQEEETKVIGFPERKRIIKGRSTAAGTPIDGDVEDSEAETTVVDREEIPRNADEIITIAGDSMEPFLMKGEQAFIQYTPWVENGTAAVVSIEDVGVTCKYVYVEGQDIRLVSENDAYDDMIYPCEEVRIIGKIL